MYFLIKLLLTVVCWSTLAFYTKSQKIKYHHLFIKRLNDPETTEYYCDVVPKNYEFNRNLTLYGCLGSLEAWALNVRKTPPTFDSSCSGIQELHHGKATLLETHRDDIYRYISKVVYSCDEGYTLFPKTNSTELESNCINEEWTHPNVTCQKLESFPFTQMPVDNNILHPPTVPDAIREESSLGCFLPQEVGNRLFCHHSCSQCIFNPSSTCSYLFGEQRLQAVRIQCIPGYGLNYNQDHSWSTCFNNTWVPSLPECKRVCPPLESDSLHVRCFNGISEVNCSRPQLPGTSVTYNCRASHRGYPSLSTAGVYRRSIICRESGTWSRPLPECEPICGVSKSNATITPSIVDGEESELGTFPWHAGLYRRNSTKRENWDYICGGSLLSNRIILTAAHCVFKQSPGDLKMALGKKHSSWSHQELYTVKRDVSDIKVPPEYVGAATGYTWDIALVILNESVQFNSFVMPVCWGEPDFHLARDDVGYVVGWGKTSPGGNNSEILLQNTVSILEDTECRKRTTFILSVDKFCGEKNAVSVVQKGDSGGGLTAIVNGIHFIFGIVSINWNELSMFTNVSWTSHQRWLENEMLRIDSK